MAGLRLSARLLLLRVVCFVVCVSDASGEFRVRVRNFIGRSKSSASAGTIVGIVFGVIGGILIMVAIVFLILYCCCNDRKSGSSKSSSRGNTNGRTTPWYAASPTQASTVDNNDSASNRNHTTSIDNTTTYHKVSQPPSYDSAVKEHYPLSDNMNRPPYTSGDSGYPAFPSAGYCTDTSGSLPYSSNPNKVASYSSPSSHPYDRGEGSGAHTSEETLPCIGFDRRG